MYTGNEKFDNAVIKLLVSWFIAQKQEKGNFEYIEFKIIHSSGEALLDKEKYLNGRDGIEIW